MVYSLFFALTGEVCGVFGCGEGAAVV